ncbi:hypothetical protein PPACK8108_LOCUS7319 [Phakopsora pachyrhizi]|uniref:Uncharacterized protein n=1 Tax=Phakopsora pachyrhizi TaxID=170000 RepID=A0AAV0AUM7_PHAPC|nr:hypothetical protein PPACK8108_LOCUS7319 [Phakopsora pachyrhizi]
MTWVVVDAGGDIHMEVVTAKLIAEVDQLKLFEREDNTALKGKLLNSKMYTGEKSGSHSDWIDTGPKEESPNSCKCQDRLGQRLALVPEDIEPRLWS